MQQKTQQGNQHSFLAAESVHQANASVEMLAQLWAKLPDAIIFFLTELVFPEMMRFQSEKISASGGDLAGRLVFRKRCGFTGTLSDLLPMSMGKGGGQPGTQGEILVRHGLSNTRSKWPTAAPVPMTAVLVSRR